MLNYLAVVCFIVKAEDSAQVLECGWSTLVLNNDKRWKGLTQFQMLLRAAHELGNPYSQTFR
jgi:hypothetical protein